MFYSTKIKINGIEITEDGGMESPSISSVQLVNSACQSAMEIGAAASDCLQLTITNPFKASFDGDRIEFYVSPIYDDATSTKELIENEVGDFALTEAIDSNEEIYIEEDADEGEELTEEELAEAEAYTAELNQLQTEFFDGESLENEELETNESEEPEWILMGVFYVYSQTKMANSVTLTCYDTLSLLNIQFASSGSARTFNDYWKLLQNDLAGYGIALEPFEIDSSELLTIKAGTSQRDALKLLCGYAGGFATANSDGSVGISFYSYTGSLLIEDEMISISDTSSGEILIDAIECEDDKGNVIISDGGGQSIRFKNYLVTEKVLNDEIAPLYRGIRFGGAIANVNWTHELVAGEFIRIMTKDEYSNYVSLTNAAEDTLLEQNSLGRVILISSQRISFGGNATSIISSNCETVSAKDKYAQGDLLKQIQESNIKSAEAINKANDALSRSYTWIAYADDANGVGISLDPAGKSYMGTAPNQAVEEVDITDPTVFTWSQVKGEDAVLLRIDSSRGTVFKNNEISTVLSVIITKGPLRITDSKALAAEFGAGAYLQWSFQRIDENDFSILSVSDERLRDNGFSLNLSPNDIDTKCNFRCQLII